ncbi:MAG: hypothetical protein IPG43_18065 [Proteobacteria bacterium]|nr:hypothetical protein [Pseudomonadota bacterium]
MSGPGVLSVTAGVHNFLASSSITGANFTFSGATMNMGGTYDISGITTVSGGTNSLAAANVVNLGNVLTVSGGSLDLGALSPTVTTFNQSGGTLSGTGTLTVSGASTLSTPGFGQASMTGTGTTRFDGALSVTGGGLHDLTGGRRLLTTATTTWTNSSGNSGQFRLGGGAVIENRALWLDDTSVSTSINSTFGGSNTFLNTATGTYRKTGATTTAISTAMNNDGLVEIQNGVLELGGGGTHTGDFVMSGPGVLSVTGGTHNFLASSSISGVNFTFAGGTLNMGGSYDISGTTTVTNGTHSLAAATVVNLGSVLTVSGGSLDLGALSPTVTEFQPEQRHAERHGHADGDGCVDPEHAGLRPGVDDGHGHHALRWRAVDHGRGSARSDGGAPPADDGHDVDQQLGQ